MQLRRTTDREEAQRLLAAGARLRRFAHDMAVDLAPAAVAGPGPAPAGLRVGPIGDPGTLATLSAASTPEGHPDHSAWVSLEERAAYWRRLVAGEVCGPLLEGPSGRLLDRLGETAAVVVVTRMPPTTWWEGGPWIAEVYAAPGRQGSGFGSWLIRRALAESARLGERRLGLTVTDANPAERLYARLGFRRIRSLYVLETGG